MGGGKGVQILTKNKSDGEVMILPKFHDRTLQTYWTQQRYSSWDIGVEEEKLDLCLANIKD